MGSRFTRGVGCFVCRICGRRTRERNDPTAVSAGLCDECFEAASIENQMSDEGETAELLAQWERLIALAESKGGKVDRKMWWRHG